MKIFLTLSFGILLILAGMAHFIKPEIYFAMIPKIFPPKETNYLAGVIEILCGIAVFIPTFRSLGTLGIFVLMLLFLPIHIIDACRDSPAIGSHQLALLRIPLQFILIAWAWYIYKDK